MTDYTSECDLITCLFAVQLIDTMAGVGPGDDRVKLTYALSAPRPEWDNRRQIRKAHRLDDKAVDGST
jgi:hypothetical protein